MPSLLSRPLSYPIAHAIAKEVERLGIAWADLHPSQMAGCVLILKTRRRPTTFLRLSTLQEAKEWVRAHPLLRSHASLCDDLPDPSLSLREWVQARKAEGWGWDRTKAAARHAGYRFSNNDFKLYYKTNTTLGASNADRHQP